MAREAALGGPNLPQAQEPEQVKDCNDVLSAALTQTTHAATYTLTNAPTSLAPDFLR